MAKIIIVTILTVSCTSLVGECFFISTVKANVGLFVWFSVYIQFVSTTFNEIQFPRLMLLAMEELGNRLILNTVILKRHNCYNNMTTQRISTPSKLEKHCDNLKFQFFNL